MLQNGCYAWGIAGLMVKKAHIAGRTAQKLLINTVHMGLIKIPVRSRRLRKSLWPPGQNIPQRILKLYDFTVLFGGKSHQILEQFTQIALTTANALRYFRHADNAMVAVNHLQTAV